jgi:hypothetical protein
VVRPQWSCEDHISSASLGKGAVEELSSELSSEMTGEQLQQLSELYKHYLGKTSCSAALANFGEGFCAMICTLSMNSEGFLFCKQSHNMLTALCLWFWDACDSGNNVPL